MNERIKLIRTKAGLTQQQFADRIKVKRNTVATYEMGRSIPSDAAIALICREFNVNEEWLRSGEGEMFYIPDDEDAALISEILENHDERLTKMILNIIRTYKQLSPESKIVVENFIDQLLENKNRKD